MTRYRNYAIVCVSKENSYLRKRRRKEKDMLTVIKFCKSSYSFKHSSYSKKNSIVMSFYMDENSV